LVWYRWVLGDFRSDDTAFLLIGMKSFIALFEVIEDNNCPLYEVGECFRLTERSVTPPEKKEVCLILVREMTELLFVLLGETNDGSTDTNEKKYSCSGCTGLIKFRLIPTTADSADGVDPLSLNAEQQALLGRIVDCPLFRPCRRVCFGG
jgi:CRP/FNR family transcriptional regulator, cyclic AMP receptor protein